MLFYTYILRCRDNTYYIGSTSNITKRLDAHNRLKSGAHYTKIRRPVVLVYVEVFETLHDARVREHQLKKLTRTQKELLIQNSTIPITSA